MLKRRFMKRRGKYGRRSGILILTICCKKYCRDGFKIRLCKVSSKM
jgi:hypothetical protein